MKDIIYTRKYTDRNGNEKKEYITAGYMFEKDGRISILMKNYINIASFQNEKGEVWLNVYDHKTTEKQEKSVYKGSETVKVVQQAVNAEPAQKENADDGDVPF